MYAKDLSLSLSLSLDKEGDQSLAVANLISIIIISLHVRKLRENPTIHCPLITIPDKSADSS